MSDRKNQSNDRKKESLKYARYLIGKKLISICNRQCFINSQINEDDIGDIEICCSDSVVVSLFLLSDAASIGADFSTLEPDESFEFENILFNFTRQDLLQSMQANHLISQTIISVQGLLDCYDNHQILSGYKIVFENLDFLVFYNAGDEGKVLLNQLPKTLAFPCESSWIDAF